MSLILPAIKFKQRMMTMYIAVVPVSLLDHFVVDIWDPKNIKHIRGYQRNPDNARIRKIAKFFEKKGAIMPVAGLVNIRDKSKTKYENGKLIIPDATRVWVVDMQHRLHGLVKAKEDGLIRGNFSFPIVLTEGLSQIEEAVQFYVINTRAKKMDVALTRRLLIENNLIKDIADAKPWEISAVRITIDINRKIVNNPWYKAIREPNAEKMVTHIATEKSFVASLRQLLISGRAKQPHKTAKRLSKFWLAIQENVPECFQEPNRYILQRTSGMYAFNFFIAPYFLAKYKDKDFSKKLKGLQRLGADFWKRI